MNAQVTVPEAGFASWGGRPLATSDEQFPKVIWSYWHDGSLPEIVRIAVKSWAVFAPDYEVRMLTRESAERLTGTMPRRISKRTPQAISDWVRLELLREHGGVWIDASLILFSPIEKMLPDAEIVAAQPFLFFNRKWSTDPVSPMLESWFIAAPKGSELVRKWAREYNLACYSRKRYLQLAGMIYGKAVFQGYPRSPYFTVFTTLQVVLRRNKHLAVATLDSEDGPYLLHKHADYDADKIRDYLMTGVEFAVRSVKLTSRDRPPLESALAMRRPAPESPLSNLLVHSADPVPCPKR